MPRSARQTPGGYVYHVFNRAAGRMKLFRKRADYEAFVGVIDEGLAKHSCRVLAYCVMPTHWHLVLWPKGDGDLSAFLRWLTLTHAIRWQSGHQRVGSGHVYQNRFKTFPVQANRHLYTVLRYVEGNAQRAGLVRRARAWPWSSAACRLAGPEAAARRLHAWPVPFPKEWLKWVEKPLTEAELAAVREAVARGRPYGTKAWVATEVQRLGLQSSVRPRGRPRKSLPVDQSKKRGKRDKK